jgi:hypothetical protein
MWKNRRWFNRLAPLQFARPSHYLVRLDPHTDPNLRVKLTVPPIQDRRRTSRSGSLTVVLIGIAIVAAVVVISAVRSVISVTVPIATVIPCIGVALDAVIGLPLQDA